MKVFRLSKSKYRKDLEGIGAKKAGGRWNNVNVACVYTSDSRALAVLEYSANIELEFVPRALHITTYEIPEDEFIQFDEADFPGEWKAVPSASSTKDFGSFYMNDPDVLGIKVPSILVPEEYNYLINPNAKNISTIHVLEAKDFIFDVRVKG
jgi:RES domain-containing protein